MLKKHKKLNVLKTAKHIGIRFKQLMPDFEEGKLPSCKIELMFNSKAFIEGCRGIAEYSDERISLNVEKGLIMFCGTGLSLESFENGDVIIKGKISDVLLKS